MAALSFARITTTGTMPRSNKPKKNPQAIAPGDETTTVAAAPEKLPIAEVIANHQAQSEPAQADPQAEAIASFQRQREREQAVDSAPLLPPEGLPTPQTEV